jgi:transcriptional regulator with XRE-family HTH domain
MDKPLTFGEYMRRLRRVKGLSLHDLAEQTRLSYSHLSRIENDSSLPQPNTVVQIATALDGDLKQMLELADCLPQIILDRMAERGERAGEPLKRSAGGRREEWSPESSLNDLAMQIARTSGLTPSEARAMANAFERLVNLEEHQRSAVTSLIRSLSADGED